MSYNWPRVKISDVCKLIVDCVNKTAPQAEFETPYKMIRTPNIKNGKVSLNDCRFVSEETYEKWTRRAKVIQGDVLLTREAPMGEVGIIDFDDTVFLGQRIMQYRTDKTKIDPYFLLYAFLSKDLQHQFSMHEGSGSVVSHIRVPDCLKFELNLPPLKVQKKIVNILKSIDQKIKNNTQTNQTLENMAQAIFKSWFVDFDPVKAKMRGEQPVGMNTTTAALFPDNLVESELGLIPEGWEVKSLSDYINIKHGFAFKGEYFSDKETNDICITPGNFHIGGGIKLDKLKYYDGPIPDEYVFSEGDLMVTMTDLSKKADTLGYPALIPNNEEKTYLHNQRIGKVEIQIAHDIKNYLYSFFCSNGYRNEILSGVTGSTVKHTAPKKIMAIQVAIDLDVAEKFSKLISPLFDNKTKNLTENRYLMSLRDTLLPKLLSGEIDLAEPLRGESGVEAQQTEVQVA